VEALTDGLVQTLPARENWVVAVADFADLKGKVTDLGRYLAQRATTRFSQQQGFRAVDRVRLLQALEELRVEASALTNPVLARRVGNHIGFNALVMGTLADLGEAVELDARLTDLDSGQQLPAVLVRLPKSPELMALVDAETIAPKPGAAQAAPAGMPGEAGLMVLDDAQPPPQTANDAYRVTVVLARKVGSALQLVIDFENLTPDVLPLLLRKNGYLIDERGERWNQTGPDSARIWVFCCDAGIELIPGTRLRTRLEFRGEGDGEGTAFTLVGKEISPQKERTLVLSGLRLKPAGQ
jgi:TolB-like protein